MTTPLFISESVPLEIRNILKALDIGAKVRFRGEDGEISFVSDQYITICTRKIPDPVHRYGYRAVNVLVYPHEWDDLEIDDSYFKKYTSQAVLFYILDKNDVPTLQSQGQVLDNRMYKMALNWEYFFRYRTK